MTAFIKLQAHRTKHAYIKGAYRGDAPADPSRRWRDTHRVAKRFDFMAVIMHKTDILRAYEDGSFVINTEGWHDHLTTKQAVREALRFTPLSGHGIYSRRVFGKSQLCITLKDGRVVRYYDGMRFDANGVLTTDLVPFERCGINKQEVKEFAEAVKASGFKAMFPLLYASCKAPDNCVTHVPEIRSIVDTVTTDYRAPAWTEIIEYYKFIPSWDYKTLTRGCIETGDAKSCWAAIMKACKSRMYETTTTTVSAL